MDDALGDVFLPSNNGLVGVSAVETSETESFRIINWAGEIGGDVELSDLIPSVTVCPVDLVLGRSGNSEFNEPGGSLAVGLLRGMSSNFHS